MGFFLSIHENYSYIDKFSWNEKVRNVSDPYKFTVPMLDLYPFMYEHVVKATCTYIKCNEIHVYWHMQLQ